ncbi:MAG: putative zinc-binding metallopeptidase [Prevotellaceae bacterium]|jgi:substrate import-associated zinc metallohydrolase lipoprotein|nr:putative zinc-binding metallopeptidase [Prevotellaceae bacterium]
MTKRIVSFFVCSILIFNSCDQDPIDRNKSIFDTTEKTKTPFEEWLYENYTKEYNIDFKYKFEDIESDIRYNLVPAREENAVALAQIVKHVWIDAYDEMLGNKHFMRKYVPKIIHLIGSPAYNDDGSIVLGTAEGGLKVTLYMVNNLDVNSIDMENLNYYYFHTMHHEFAHILHQTKEYDTEWKQISNADYIGNNWIYEVRDTVKYRKKGFISAYSMMNHNEDFVEYYSYYVTNSQSWWDNEWAKGGAEGIAIMNKKLTIVRNYFKQVWNIDLDKMREIVLSRSAEVPTLGLLTFTNSGDSSPIPQKSAFHSDVPFDKRATLYPDRIKSCSCNSH